MSSWPIASLAMVVIMTTEGLLEEDSCQLLSLNRSLKRSPCNGTSTGTCDGICGIANGGVPQEAAVQKCHDDCNQPGFNCQIVSDLYPGMCYCLTDPNKPAGCESLGPSPVPTPTPTPTPSPPTPTPPGDWTPIGSNLNFDCNYHPQCMCANPGVAGSVFPCTNPATCNSNCNPLAPIGPGGACACQSTAGTAIAAAAACEGNGGGFGWGAQKSSFGHPMHAGQGCGECVYIKCGDFVFAHMAIDNVGGWPANYEVSGYAFNDAGTGWCTEANRGTAEWKPNPSCEIPS